VSVLICVWFSWFAVSQTTLEGKQDFCGKNVNSRRTYFCHNIMQGQIIVGYCIFTARSMHMRTCVA